MSTKRREIRTFHFLKYILKMEFYLGFINKDVDLCIDIKRSANHLVSEGKVANYYILGSHFCFKSHFALKMNLCI